MDFEQLGEVMKTTLKKRNPTFVRGENRVKETSQTAFTVIKAYIESSLVRAEAVDRRLGTICLFVYALSYLKEKHFKALCKTLRNRIPKRIS